MKRFSAKTVKKLIKLCVKLTVVLVIAVCVLAAAGFGYASDTFHQIKENVVRLHVIANSDSEEDQALKLQVRDKVIEYIDDLEIDAESAGAYVKKLCENINTVKEQLEDYLRGIGSEYGVDVSVGESNFPAKSYGDIVLPAGKYNAVRVTIGAGEGRNWWCVMFPPLCYTNNGSVKVNETENALLKKTLPEEAYKTVKGTVSPDLNEENITLIADDSLVSDKVEVNVRFKIVEIFQESGQKIEKAWESCKRFFKIK